MLLALAAAQGVPVPAESDAPVRVHIESNAPNTPTLPDGTRHGRWLDEGPF
jgi:hypothetical protein